MERVVVLCRVYDFGQRLEKTGISRLANGI
jgi:hypothetical protein